MRVRVALFAGQVAALVLAVPASARVDDGSTLKAWFLRDYAPALEVLEARYSRVRGVAKCTDERHFEGSTDSYTTTLEFECKLPSMVRVVETGKLDVTKGEAARSRGVWRVQCSNAAYLFELKKHATDGKFSVTSLLNNAEREFKDETRSRAASLLEYLGAPFYLDVHPMSKLLPAKNVSIRSVSRVSAGTRQMLKVELEMKPAREGGMSLEGWFTVSPDEAWVIHEYKFDWGDITRRGTMEYGETQAGVPVLKRLTRSATKRGKLLNAQTYDFEKLDFADVPDRDFTLAAFDLPEVGRPTARRPDTSAPWLLAFSLLALAAAVALKVAASRFQRKKAEGTGT